MPRKMFSSDFTQVTACATHIHSIKKDMNSVGFKVCYGRGEVEFAGFGLCVQCACFLSKVVFLSASWSCKPKHFPTPFI